MDAYPGSSQVRLLGLDQADDKVIWRYAAQHGYTIVSQDADFAELVALGGAPPKVVWLRCGNRPTRYICELLLSRVEEVRAFEAAANLDCLELT